MNKPIIAQSIIAKNAVFMSCMCHAQMLSSIKQNIFSEIIDVKTEYSEVTDHAEKLFQLKVWTLIPV